MNDNKLATANLDLINKSAWLGIKAKVAPTSLTLPNDLAYDQWAEIGLRISRIKRFSNWALADWLNFGEKQFSETYAQGVAATGFQPDYLAIIKYVGAAVEPSRRRESLSFSHHRLVASLNPEAQDQFLREAEENDWSQDVLREAIKASKAHIEVIDQPAIETERRKASQIESIFREKPQATTTAPSEKSSVESISNAAIAYLRRVTKDLLRSEIKQVMEAINREFDFNPSNGIGSVDAKGWERIL